MNGINIFHNIDTMERTFNISKVLFNQNQLIITIDGQEFKFNTSEISNKLNKADDKQRNNFIISPSGYGIHWPSLDEDLSINGLLNLQKNRHVA